MESTTDPEHARKELLELQQAQNAVARETYVPSPGWYAFAIGLLGPAIVVFETRTGAIRATSVAVALLTVGFLVAHDVRRRSRVRRRRQTPSSRQFGAAFAFQLLLIGSLIVTSAVAGRVNSWVAAVVSYLVIAGIMAVFGRRLEDVARAEALGEGS